MIGWPDRFIYVCSATQASIVNVLPIVHAGVERIEKVIVFCGAPNPNTTDARLQREAILPARRLVETVRSLGREARQPPGIERLHGDSARLTDWAIHMRAICASAREAGTPVVFNVTGGAKLMALGAFMGGDETMLKIYVGGAPLRVEFVTVEGQVEAPRHAEMSLAQYLALYGVRERAKARRVNIQRRCLRHREAIRAFAEALYRRPELIRELLTATKGLFHRNDQFVAGRIDRLVLPNKRLFTASRHLRTALNSWRGVSGVRFGNDRPEVPGSIDVDEEWMARMLRGAWLEAEIYFALLDACKGRNDVEIAMNVALQFASAKEDNPFSDIGEIDVAVMVRSQLHAIEGKTAGFSGKASKANAEQSVAQIEALKRHLLGQFGQYIAVNPRETEESLRGGSGDFMSRMESAGIDFALGPKAVETAAQKIARLL